MYTLTKVSRLPAEILVIEMLPQPNSFPEVPAQPMFSISIGIIIGLIIVGNFEMGTIVFFKLVTQKAQKLEQLIFANNLMAYLFRVMSPLMT